VATNLALDEVRRRTRRGRLLRMRPSAQPLADPPEDPAAAVERAEVTMRVRKALAAVPERDRTVLLLREEGFCHREIAEVVGTTEKSIGTMIARAMVKVEAALNLTRDET
jgi:RNA polymerase sigma factor (sigma-70 family)